MVFFLEGGTTVPLLWHYIFLIFLSIPFFFSFERNKERRREKLHYSNCYPSEKKREKKKKKKKLATPSLRVLFLSDLSTQQNTTATACVLTRTLEIRPSFSTTKTLILKWEKENLPFFCQIVEKMKDKKTGKILLRQQNNHKGVKGKKIIQK